MTDSDKVNMTINIGGEYFDLSAPFDQQDAVRDAEIAASRLYDAWRANWTAPSDKEILARVAFQFALNYQRILDKFENASALASDIDKRLADIIAMEKNA